jgi:hypothetical protein
MLRIKRLVTASLLVACAVIPLACTRQSSPIALSPSAEVWSSSTQTWSSSDTPVRLGDIQVQIKNVVIGRVLMTDALRGQVNSNEELLAIELTINTSNPTKKLEYHSWMGDDRSSQNRH